MKVNPSVEGPWLPRLAWGLSALAVLLSCSIAVARAFYNLSITEPLQTFTSGCEEESLFAIWKWVHGQSIYADPTHIPFAASYFNWLFYAIYGVLTEMVQTLLRLEDAWITQVGKWITLGGTLILGGAVYRLLRIVQPGCKTGLSTLAFIGVAICIALSPHIGFWYITTRPDVWALGLEVLALGSYLRSLRTRAWSDLVWFLIFSYAAWGFKQVNVAIAAACILHAAWRGRLGVAALLGLILASAFLLTLVVGGGEYRYMLMKSQMHMGFYAHIGSYNLRSALAKSTLLWVPFLVTLAWSGRHCVFTRKVSLDEDRVLVLHLAAAVAFILYLPLAFKVGAADNYFLPFTAAAMLAWVCAAQLAVSRQLLAAIAIGSAFCILGCVAVLSGKRGAISCRAQHSRLMAIKSHLATLPQPVLAWDNLASLPWINTGAVEHFVVAAAYFSAPPETYESGGVEGLVAGGCFASVLDLGDAHRELCERYLQKVPTTNGLGSVYLHRTSPAAYQP